MSKKYESTAKELAFKAYCDGIKGKDTRYDDSDPEELFDLSQRFELWWRDHSDRFYSKHTVFIDLKKYILAE